MIFANPVSNKTSIDLTYNFPYFLCALYFYREAVLPLWGSCSSDNLPHIRGNGKSHKIVNCCVEYNKKLCVTSAA